MLEIQRVNIPDNKKILLSLTYIHGIGLSTANRLLNQININKDKKTKNLTFLEIQKIRMIVYYLILETDLKKSYNLNLKRVIELKSYRSKRFISNLPLRGQRTRTNAKTRRNLGISTSLSNIALKLKKKKIN